MAEEEVKNNENITEDDVENETAEETESVEEESEAQETPESRPPRYRGAGGGQGQSSRRSGDNRRSGPSRRFNRRLKKVCQFCQEGSKGIDYKRVDLLQRFITERGNIRSRRKVGTCAKHQRQLAVAIKRARHLALLPYTADHIRGA